MINKRVCMAGLSIAFYATACSSPTDSQTEVKLTALRAETMLAAQGPNARVADLEQLGRMEEYLDAQNDPRIIVETLRVDNDEVIDCVDMRRQNGFDQPIDSLSVPPKNQAGLPKENWAKQFYGTVTKTCPNGTIPRRRAKIDELVQFYTVEDYFRKVPRHLGVGGEPLEEQEHGSAGMKLMAAGPTDLHQYAAVRDNVTNIGAEASLSLHNPGTEKPGEFSLSQIWVARGSGANTETVEAGWQVYRSMYGNGARLFVYFTPDNYGSGGCYNLTCGKFVQTNNTYVLGGAFASYSSLGNYEVTVGVRLQMNTTGDWWLQVNGVWIGYWPNNLFDTNGISVNASRVTFGGEIIDDTPNSRHTLTDMGSGYFPSAGYLWAAFQRSMRYYTAPNASPGLNNVVPDTYIITGSACYDLSFSVHPTTGPFIFFGGPGYSSQCE